LTSLPDDDALSAVALGPAGLAGILAPNAVHISTSTVSPPVSRRVAEEHASHGQDYVAAPVLGNPDFARERKLFVLAAGLPSAMQKIRPLLERLGQQVFVVGEEPALANLVTLAASADCDNARMHGRGIGLDAKSILWFRSGSSPMARMSRTTVMSMPRASASFLTDCSDFLKG
jgi:3-hydroxyisobutyrate dehydrogenase-like beta-hydroxyacid dehydrogenase